MKNELTIIKQLRDVVDAELNPVTPTRDGQDPEPTAPEIPVVIDFPSVDRMPASNVVWMLPDYAEYEWLGTESDNASLRVRMWILSKRAPQSDLFSTVYRIYNQIYELLRQDTSLSGYVDFTEVNSADFVDAVEMNRNVQGVFVTLVIRYTKDY